MLCQWLGHDDVPCATDRWDNVSGLIAQLKSWSNIIIIILLVRISCLAQTEKEGLKITVCPRQFSVNELFDGIHRRRYDAGHLD